MTDPRDVLRDVARDDWADPVGAARIAAVRLLELAGDDSWDPKGLEAVSELRRHRADSPLLLAATAAANQSDRLLAADRLRDFIATLDDRRWAEEAARRALPSRFLGVTSMGFNTLAVLEASMQMGAEWEMLLCNQRSVSQGLGFLRVPVTNSPPEQGDAVLAAGAAAFGPKMWTTTRIADVVMRAHVRGTEVIPVVHPLAHLSSKNRKAYRPAPALIDVELDR